ncbi:MULTISPECIES: 3-hydroxyacyl-CoA dehydrogenase NAD-binding domain-containing protein [unclassified Halomonas]|uniref:3-hydroxyacyl-CoA dehydrogenase NAD-binding domain-containing protein n=1 Tax=unclassified Halomonas TaxID=2609666 RepID=UPI000990711B|nr:MULTISPECIES: 3-hydroxyacyl-CoA dehydrogenase NAD-binding domain-containing protein [unclassified Halomonas]AQU84723.1 3-hydroxyacyl-CoA dehydrogenase [Halomonas sp. 'Soap Lake \
MSEPVTCKQHDSVLLITIDNPPVNALSAAVRLGLSKAFAVAEQEPTVKAVVLRCAGRTFIAGADITEFGKPMQPPALPEVLGQIDTFTKPVVAALHGTALGGGFETALTCHYRIAEASARVGLPEVKLGLLPGSGGTQRLPRLIDVKSALDMIVSGRQVAAPEAMALGAIDRIAEGDLTEQAMAYARELVDNSAPLRRCSDMAVNTADIGATFFAEYRAQVAKQQRGLEAPQACIEAIEIATTQPFAEGLKKERELFLERMASPESAALRHVFFAERQAPVVTDLPRDTPKREIRRVGIIGAGTMGSGIAINFLNAGIPVTLLEMKSEALERGIKTIQAYYDDRKAKGRMSEEKANACFARLAGTLDYADFDDVDLAIEAVFENMAVKHEVFAKLDEVCKPGAILASNTSYLDVNQIAAATSRPQDVLGLHFFSPAHVMRLLEVVRADKTADDVLATAMKLLGTIGKVGVVSGVCDGFIGNRMLKGYGREAGILLLEGASPSQIDSTMNRFGMAMGPMAMGDLAGLDIGSRAREERRQRGETVSPTDGAVADRLVEMGRLGQKSGKGYYRYEAGSRKPILDPEVDTVIEQAAKQLGIERRDISEEEILQRLIYPLINEAAKILEEGIAQRPSDIDVVWINGYGFPTYRGGPMHYADNVGLASILAAIKQYQQRYGDTWQAAPLLERLVQEGKRFSDL